MQRLSLLSLLFTVFLAAACQKEPPAVQAFRVTDRSQLFGGGPRALGDIGDYMLMNDRIRVVIQNAGFSRGFGVYGGGLIDADLRRPDEQGRDGSNRRGGNDIFAEMFPSFFFQAVACDKVQVLTDGSQPYDHDYGNTHVHYDVGTAVVRASGKGGEFLTMLRVFDSIFLNFIVPTDMESAGGGTEFGKLASLLFLAFSGFAEQVAMLVNDNALYEIDYVLKPGTNHVEIHGRMINNTTHPLAVPSALLKNQLFQQQLGGVDLSGLRVPIGNVLLFGLLNNVWLPGAGFDLRHPIERSFRRALSLPAFNGIVTEFIASASNRMGDRVSYGLVGVPSDDNFVYLNQGAYRTGGKYVDTWTPIDRSSMLVPFTAISFIGVFTGSVKTTIRPGEYIEMVQDFIVGGGDVASIVDEVSAIRGEATGRYEAQLLDGASREPIADGQLLIYQVLDPRVITADAFAREDDYLDAGLRLCEVVRPGSLCRPYSQDYPDAAGNLVGNLPPGQYAYRLQGTGRALGPWVPFEIKAGERTLLTPVLDVPAWLQAIAVDEAGRPIPAKISVVGQYGLNADGSAFTNAQRRSGRVFDVQAGESYRFTDMVDDTVMGQRAYIEAVGATDASGRVSLALRPGDYTVYFSRGFEYDLASAPVTVTPGNVAIARGQVRRVVDTSGWLAMDSHLHSENSIDSNMAVRDRLLSAAAEGVEIAISTDHNFVSDWRPSLEAMALTPWMTSFVGIEFTTLESGHFNSFPLAYKVGPVTHGAFEWFGHPPKDLFDGLRGISQLAGGNNIVVCNHPRDATQGYFNQYGRSSLTGGRLSFGQSKRLAGPNGSAFFDARGATTFSLDCDALEIVNGKLAHELHSVRVPAQGGEWPDACYLPLPVGFDPKKQLDPCSLNGKILRPSTFTGALVPGTILTDLSKTADPGPSGIDNLEAAFPGAIEDWFHTLNQGLRKTGLATSDSHGSVGGEPGLPRTYLRLDQVEPSAVDAASLVDVIKTKHAATLSHGPFLTFTVAPGADASGGVPIGSEVAAPDGNVTINYHLAAPPWVSVNRIHVWLNGKLDKKLPIDPARDLSDAALPAQGPMDGHVNLVLARDSWIVLEAVGDKPMFPVVTGTEEPFLLVSDAVGALAGPLGIALTTDIGAVVVGNEQPFAITNPVWVRVKGDTWQKPGVVPFADYNVPEQDSHVGVLRTHN